jgi:glycerol dehydrogenase-like iron-containing ADH family enzyme
MRAENIDALVLNALVEVPLPETVAELDAATRRVVEAEARAHGVTPQECLTAARAAQLRAKDGAAEVQSFVDYARRR